MRRLDLTATEIQRLKSDAVIGAWMLDRQAGVTDAEVMRQQRLMQTLYESRFASAERLIGFMVLLHALGKAVQDFWPRASCGLLGYDMSRTQSIMRVASTAAPVSGPDLELKRILWALLSDLSRMDSANLDLIVRSDLVECLLMYLDIDLAGGPGEVLPREKSRRTRTSHTAGSARAEPDVIMFLAFLLPVDPRPTLSSS